MASARTTTRTGSAGSSRGPAKPRGAKKPPAPPRERLAALDVLPVIEEDEGDVLPAPPPVPECPFPFEMLKGRCPVAVFNSPDSPNETLAFPKADRRNPLKFNRGVLGAFSDEDAVVVRAANPGGKVYVEADPRLSYQPLICATCYPRTRWYSTVAYERHMRRAHSNG
jgi:hypothetical protein